VAGVLLIIALSVVIRCASNLRMTISTHPEPFKGIEKMKRHLTFVFTLAAAIAIAVMGCQRSAANHKLVATGDKHSVPLYHDKATYQKASHQPEASGTNADQVDDQTPVVIISSDDSGAVVEIVDGPRKGKNGFVARDNVD
jgi:hypothetical protein